MSCIIYYNGKQYSEQDFKNLINKLKDKYGTNDNTNSSNSSSNSEGDRNRLNLPSSMNEITNHSGGAYGGDTYWDIIGREFGVTNHRHYRDAGNTRLSQKLHNKDVKATELSSEEMETARKEVENLLGKKYPNTIQGNLQVRNYYQVANSDGVFAVATLDNTLTGVTGGTNTAVQLGIKLRKPIYVWDVNTEQWYEYKNGSKISWARKANNSYEVSSKGDKRFSALYAKLKDGRTIEEAYQLDIKGFREKGNDWKLGKGKVPLRKISREQSWDEYKNLWRTYLNENPDLKQDLIEKSKGKVLTDMFASTDISQARALAEILNEESGVFIPTETPTLTKNFAGVGTRDIENYNTLDKESNKWIPRKEYVGDEKSLKAQQAIRDVYQKTQSLINEKENSNNIDNDTFKKKFDSFFDNLNFETISKSFEYLGKREIKPEELSKAKDYLKNGVFDWVLHGEEELIKNLEFLKSEEGYENLYDIFWQEGVSEKEQKEKADFFFNLIYDLHKHIISQQIEDKLFPVKINQFQYTLNTETGEVIHNSKSKGDVVETNEKQIGKVYAEYAKQNNLPVQEFNLQFYSKVFDKVVNVNNGNFVTQQEILNLFENRQPMEKILNKVLNNLTKNEFTYKAITIPTDFKLGEQQEEALKNLIDFVEMDSSSDNIRTLKGYAGTGKTSIIGYLQKYFEKRKVVFTYMAPTHAATAQLAITTAKLGNTELPNTYASSVRVSTDYRLGTETVSFTKKLEKSLKLDSKRHSGHTKVIVVDEASMLNPKQVKDLNDLSSNENVLVIYMGDDMQIPAVDTSNARVKPVSPVFKKEHTLELTQVFRQKDNNLLDNLTKIREEKDFSAFDITAKEGDNSLIIPNNKKDFNSALLEDFKNDPENTVFIAYTNQAVQNFNKGLKETLTGTTNLTIGDKIVGYLGMGSKQVTSGLANSISYVIKDIKYNSTNTARVDLISYSKTLDTLHSLGVKNSKDELLTSRVTTRYYQLSELDSLKIEGATQEDMDKNNKYLSDKIRRNFEDYLEALANRNYSLLEDIKRELNDMFANLDLGGDYIYDYAQNKLVPPGRLSTQATPQITNTLKAYYNIKKGVDYGYAITAHKSQGMTIDNVYVDTNNIETSAANIPIIDENKKQITTEKKSILYVSLSRGKNKVVVSPTALTRQSDTTSTKQSTGNISDIQANVIKSLDFKGVLEFPESKASEYAKAIKTYIFDNIGIKDVSKMVHIDKNVKSEYVDDNGKNKNFIYDFLYINKKGDKYVVKLIDESVFIDPEITNKYESFKC